MFRGGLSILREWEVLAPEMAVTFRSDRRKFQPYGLHGGKAGQPSISYLNPEADGPMLPSKINQRFKQADVFLHVTPSGGGWGEPFKRDPQSVLADWRLEKATADHVRDAYGVVIDEEKRCVDEAATAALRDGASPAASG